MPLIGRSPVRHRQLDQQTSTRERVTGSYPGEGSSGIKSGEISPWTIGLALIGTAIGTVLCKIVNDPAVQSFLQTLSTPNP